MAQLTGWMTEQKMGKTMVRCLPLDFDLASYLDKNYRMEIHLAIR